MNDKLTKMSNKFNLVVCYFYVVYVCVCVCMEAKVFDKKQPIMFYQICLHKWRKWAYCVLYISQKVFLDIEKHVNIIEVDGILRNHLFIYATLPPIWFMNPN